MKYGHSNQRGAAHIAIFLMLFSLGIVFVISLNQIKKTQDNRSRAVQPLLPLPSPVGPVELVLQGDGGEMRSRGLTHLGDPDLARIGNRWFMFFSTKKDGTQWLDLYAAMLPDGAELSSPREEWHRNIASTPITNEGFIAGAWDAYGRETPSYVYGWDAGTLKWEQRIYYCNHIPPNTSVPIDYRIGYLRYDETRSAWVRAGEPVLVAKEPWEFLVGQDVRIPWVCDPSVVYEPGTGAGGENGTWHMWYSASPQRMGHTSSGDGKVWTSRTKIFDYWVTPNVQYVNGRFEMVAIEQDGPNPRQVAQAFAVSQDPLFQGVTWNSLILPSDNPWIANQFSGAAHKYENNRMHLYSGGMKRLSDGTEIWSVVRRAYTLATPTPIPRPPTPTPSPTVTPTPTPTLLPEQRDEKRKADIEAIANALRQYKIEEGSYPSTTGKNMGAAHWINSSDPTLWLPELAPYLNGGVPIDPLNTGGAPFARGYTYGYWSDRSWCGFVYILAATMEDKSDPAAGNVVYGDEFSTNPFCYYPNYNLPGYFVRRNTVSKSILLPDTTEQR